MLNPTKDDNIHSLKNDTRNLQDVASDAKEDVRIAANNAGRKVRDLVHTASDEITHAKDTVTSQIRTNPVQSSVIALGVGFILGAFLRR